MYDQFLTPEAREILDNTPDVSLEEYLAVETERCMNNKAYTVRAKYYKEYDTCELDDHMIMYEAFYGRGITCNSGALFCYIMSDPRFAEYTHIISLEASPFSEMIRDAYSDNSHVIFVEPDSDEYLHYLATARYLINNSTWKYYFIKKPGQVIVNTWHGIPIKTLGYDLPDGNTNVKNMIRNFLFTDYLVSPVPYTTENFTSAFKLDGIFEGAIIEGGYPRIDRTIHVDRQKAIESLRGYGININPDKKIILYAPTWRGAAFANPDLNVKEYDEFLDTVSSYVNMDEYQIFFKPHQIIYKNLMDKGLAKAEYIPAAVDTNELLGIADVLISDYSSIVFDFLVTGRPLVFYVQDIESYASGRGLYFHPDILPGPVCRTVQEVGEAVGAICSGRAPSYADQYEKARDMFVKYEDGNACSRIVEAVFFGETKYIKRCDNRRPKLLVQLDALLLNGMTSAALNFVNLIDSQKYDVSFYTLGKNDLETERYTQKLPREVRVICRCGAKAGDPKTAARQVYCLEHSITANDGDPVFPSEFYQREYRRCFGDVHFDYIIDYSGFNSFYGNLNHTQKDSKKLIWMHSMFSREYSRIKNGRLIFKKHIDSLMKLYPDFDRYVSCSYSTMLSNREDFGTPETYDRYTYLNNLIDVEHVEKGVDEKIFAESDNARGLVVFQNDWKIDILPAPTKDVVSFVTVGRLSGEKNHFALIKAFRRLNKEYPNTELYIIGDGPLFQETSDLIKSLELKNKVILTGLISNPYALMSECSCFILPSLYEGLPMVLLEARVLHLPIILSNFATVKDSLFPDGQLVIGMTEDDIYGGMKAFIDGKVPNNYQFDGHRYNEAILGQLYKYLDDLEKK